MIFSTLWWNIFGKGKYADVDARVEMTLLLILCIEDVYWEPENVIIKNRISFPDFKKVSSFNYCDVRIFYIRIILSHMIFPRFSLRCADLKAKEGP